MSEASSELGDRIVRLQETLRTEKEFMVAWEYFHNELVADDDFAKQGTAAESPLINQMIKQIAASQKWPNATGAVQAIYLAEFGFWHGWKSFGQRTAIFFYSETACQGLLGSMKGFSGSVDLFRLSTVLDPFQDSRL